MTSGWSPKAEARNGTSFAGRPISRRRPRGSSSGDRLLAVADKSRISMSGYSFMNAAISRGAKYLAADDPELEAAGTHALDRVDLPSSSAQPLLIVCAASTTACPAAVRRMPSCGAVEKRQPDILLQLLAADCDSRRCQAQHLGRVDDFAVGGDRLDGLEVLQRKISHAEY